MKARLSHPGLAAVAVAALLPALGPLPARAQDAIVPAEGGPIPAPQESLEPPLPPGYVSQQYVPLYNPGANAAAVAPPSSQLNPPADAAAPAGETAPPSITFRNPSVMPRTDNATPGFAPVVGTQPPVLHDRDVVNEKSGPPRMYAPGFRLGPFDVRPDLQVMGTYNDNIYLVSKQVPKTPDYIFSVAPQVTFDHSDGTAGEPDSTQFSLFYSPTVLQFLDQSGNSSLNQNVNMQAAHRFSKLRLFVSQSYNHVSGGIIQAGDLVEQDLYSTLLGISYDLTPKVSTNLQTTYNVNRYSLGVGSNEVNTEWFVNYQVQPKLTLSVAPYIDYLTPQGSGSQYEVGGTLQLNYAYSDKTSLFAQVQAGERFFPVGDGLTQWHYQAGGTWRAAAKTFVTVVSTRSTNGSALDTGSDYVDTNVGVMVQQILVDGIVANLTASYDHADYFSTATRAAQQHYDYFSLSPGIVFHPSIWVDLGCSYLYRQNFSNIATSEFTNNQVNFFSTLRF